MNKANNKLDAVRASVGGHLALDFTNTAGGTTKKRDNGQLIDLCTTLDWAVSTGVLSPSERQSTRISTADPTAMLRHLLDLRESAYQVFSSIANGIPVEAETRHQLQCHIVEALKNAQLAINGRDPTKWHVEAEQVGSALLKYRLAIAVSELLTQATLSNVRECGACSWLFLDMSRSKSRRWCSMATCGNRIKAKRHYRAIKTAI